MALYNEVASKPELTTEMELALVRQDIESQCVYLGREKPQFYSVSGSADSHSVESDLFQNYPNPYNPTTVIHYVVSTSGSTVLKVYDLLGRQITVLVDEIKEPGQYSVSFDGSTLPTGVYFYQIVTGNKSIMKKMSVVK